MAFSKMITMWCRMPLFACSVCRLIWVQVNVFIYNMSSCACKCNTCSKKSPIVTYTIPQYFFFSLIRIPIRTYAVLAFLTVATMGLSNSSVGYLNYPTQVIFKCCKLIPVMIGGVLIQSK